MLYVRNEVSRTITSNEMGARRFELAAKGNVGSIKVLPYDVAARPGFQRVWDADEVTVSAAPDFSNPLSAIPAGEQYGDLATLSAAGNVKKAAAQADSTATTVAGLVTDFNALLAKLRAAGIQA